MRKSLSVSTLGECCQIKPPKNEARNRLSANDMVSFVPMNDLGVREKNLKAKADKPLQSVSGSYIYFADGDVLLAKITPCFENGKLGIASALTNGVGFGSSEFIVFRPGDSVDAEYLFYFLSQDSFRDAGAGVMSGAVGHKRVPKEFIEGYPIPLPPLPEQKRIVTILDEAFAGIDAAIANTQKNLANARELFKSNLNSTFSQKGEEWKLKRLGDISKINYGYTAKASTESIGPLFLRITDIQSDNVRWSQVPRCSITKKDHEKHRLKDGDIVFARTGATTGKSYLLSNPPDAVAASYLIRLRLNDKTTNPAFVALFFQTETYWNAIATGTTGSAQGGFNASKLGDLEVPLPPVSEQRDIVSELRNLNFEVNSLAAILRQKLAALIELKQSLLQKAFSGELTAETTASVEAKTSGADEEATSPQFAAHVIAAAYHWHESQRKDKTFGHVKAQKTLHMLEALADVDMGRQPYKDAAGPNDFDHMRVAERWASDNDFFKFVQRRDGQRGYDFVKGKRFGEWLGQSLKAVEPYRPALDKVVKLLLPLNTEDAELVATVYAAWNNLLLDRVEVTEEAIIHEARDNWHRDKLEYSEGRFRAAIAQIRSNGVVPGGRGKRVSGQESLAL